MSLHYWQPYWKINDALFHVCNKLISKLYSKKQFNGTCLASKYRCEFNSITINFVNLLHFREIQSFRMFKTPRTYFVTMLHTL